MVAVVCYRVMDTEAVVAGSKVVVVGRTMRAFAMEKAGKAGLEAGFAFLSFLPITISLLI